MTWPLSQDFNEAVQNPASSFADPDLKGGMPATGPHGVPLPRSGNYADVYQFTGPDGRRWAVKCFTRPVAPDLDARYAAIAGHLARASLPFTVGFEFLRQGIRVKGKFYPVVKMPWVDGFPINQFVREHLNRATPLEAMLSLWVRLCRRLRETGMAHCDLQHGNVLLVPAGGKANALELKLVDYDGMYVPALAGKPTGEAGHTAYQHPERAARNVYSADLDRFPHLVVATALRGLLVGGPALWQKYDNGDNLLFAASDFQVPGRSKLIRELWDTGDPFTVGLLAHLVLASTRPLAQAPWLDQLMPEGRPPVLTPSQERQAATILGIPVAAAVPHPPPIQPSAPALVFDDGPRRRRQSAGKGSGLIALIVLGGLVLIGVLVGVGIVILGSTNRSADATPSDPPTATKHDQPVGPVVPPQPNPQPLTATNPAPVPPTAHPILAPKPTPATKPDPNPPPAAGSVRVAWAVPLDPNNGRDVYSVRFSADGSRIIAIPDAGNMPLATFDAATGQRRAVFREHGDARPLAAPLPGGRVLSAGTEPILLVWDDATGRAIARVPLADDPANRHALATDRTGQYAAVSTPRGVQVFDIEQSRELLVVPPVGTALRHLIPLAFAPDGSGVLTAAETSLTTQALPGQDNRTTTTVNLGGPVRAILGWSPTRGLAALVVFDDEPRRTGRVVVVRLDTGQPVRTVPFQGEPLARLMPDGRHLVTAGQGRVQVWDIATGAVVGQAAVPKATVSDLDLSPDGRTAVVTASDGQLRLFTLGPGVGGEPPAAAPVAAAAAPRPPRRPVPDRDAVARADAVLRDKFKEDFARKLPAERRRLAEELVREAERAADPADRYALLRAAEAVASEQADVPLAVKAIDSLDAAYEIDGLGEKLSAAKRAVAVTRLTQAPQLKEMADTLLELAEQSVEKDQHARAGEFAALAAKALSRASDGGQVKDLLEYVGACQKHFKKLAAAHDQIRPQVERLKTKPDDPAAAAEVGKYRAFIQRRWDEALPLLARGSDPKLQALAQLDADPGKTELQRGDAWDGFARSIKPSTSDAALAAAARANDWWGRALSSPGEQAVEARKRLRLLIDKQPYLPGLLFASGYGTPSRSWPRSVKTTVDLSGQEYQRIMLGDRRILVWDGVIDPPEPGWHRLIAESSGGEFVVRLTARGKRMDTPLASATGRREAAVFLEKRMKIEIAFTVLDQGTGRPTFALKWARPGMKPDVIPPGVLFSGETDQQLAGKKK